MVRGILIFPFLSTLACWTNLATFALLNNNNDDDDDSADDENGNRINNGKHNNGDSNGNNSGITTTSPSLTPPPSPPTTPTFQLIETSHGYGDIRLLIVCCPHICTLKQGILHAMVVELLLLQPQEAPAD